MTWTKQTDLRHWLNLVQTLHEGHPRRDTDPEVAKWIQAVYRRSDVDRLYLHGSNHQFERFADPKLEYGQLIHFTKLTGENWLPGRPLQAEYYGAILYLVTVHARQPFRPLNDPKAMAILEESLRGDTWDYESKVRWGCFDYQDQHKVVPPAVAAGYDLFRVSRMCGAGRFDWCDTGRYGHYH